MGPFNLSEDGSIIPNCYQREKIANYSHKYRVKFLKIINGNLEQLGSDLNDEVGILK